MSTGSSPGHGPGFRAVALIAGPTASGKSNLAVALALEIARRGGRAGVRAVVINADSAQVYADLQVLSARPTRAEMRGVEHRLFGAWDGAEACSAADWAHAARRAIAEAHAARAVPILVGGTGLYIRTLLNGIAPVPPIHEHVREAVRALPTPAAWAALRREDPELAQALNPADRSRVARALEVVRSTGVSLLAWQRRREGGIGAGVDLHPLILLPDRALLYARCDARFERMIDQGAREEVARLLARALPDSLPVMRAIGVAQVAGWVAGRWTREDALERGRRATRNYAKRQYTWFRHQPPATWSRHEKGCSDRASHFERLFATYGLT